MTRKEGYSRKGGGFHRRTNNKQQRVQDVFNTAYPQRVQNAATLAHVDIEVVVKPGQPYSPRPGYNTILSTDATRMRVTAKDERALAKFREELKKLNDASRAEY